jgi:GntR family transcriptional regulator/MocR family aminotransferase
MKRSRSPDVSLGAGRQEGRPSAWLAETLRSAIIEGRLARGARLPSSRDFARQYGLARGTAVRVFEHLRSEGYIVSKVGAGTFVSSSLPDQRPLTWRNRITPGARKTSVGLSARGRQMERTCFPTESVAQISIPFRAYQPDLDAFPLSLWSRLVARRQRLAHRALLGVGDPRGYRPLREAAAAYLGSARPAMPIRFSSYRASSRLSISPHVCYSIQVSPHGSRTLRIQERASSSKRLV